jgi:hypothetical protein
MYHKGAPIMAHDEFFVKDNEIAILRANRIDKRYQTDFFLADGTSYHTYTKRKNGARNELARKGFGHVTGFVLERKRSVLTGQDIVIVVTMNSANKKTGNMAQIWILVVDKSPTQAHKSGCDESVCGDCQHRLNDTCYVTLHHGPGAVWRQFTFGKYPDFNGNFAVFRGRQVRFGAYGDPSLISKSIVEKICLFADSWTGYTHQWAKGFAQGLEKYFMASTDNPQEQVIANKNSWSTFMAIPEDFRIKDLLVKASFCPAGLDDSIHCIDCKKCNGASDRIRNKLIVAHGRKAHNYAFV